MNNTTMTPATIHKSILTALTKTSKLSQLGIADDLEANEAPEAENPEIAKQIEEALSIKKDKKEVNEVTSKRAEYKSVLKHIKHQIKRGRILGIEAVGGFEAEGVRVSGIIPDMRALVELTHQVRGEVEPILQAEREAHKRLWTGNNNEKQNYVADLKKYAQKFVENAYSYGKDESEMNQLVNQ